MTNRAYLFSDALVCCCFTQTKNNETQLFINQYLNIMRKLPQFLVLITFITITSFLSSCSSEDPGDATIVGAWRLGEYTSTTLTNSNGDDIKLVSTGQGDNCIYTFNENPNTVVQTGKINMEIKTYFNNTLFNTSTQTVDFDSMDLDPVAWEINGDELVAEMSDVAVSDPTLQVVSDDVVINITTLTDTTLVLKETGSVVVHSTVTNSNSTTTIDAEMHFTRD